MASSRKISPFAPDCPGQCADSCLREYQRLTPVDVQNDIYTIFISSSVVFPDRLPRLGYSSSGQIRYRGTQLMDLIYIAGIVGFCVLMALLVVGCDKLKRAPGGRP
jgi:hypothetical protein